MPVFFGLAIRLTYANRLSTVIQLKSWESRNCVPSVSCWEGLPSGVAWMACVSAAYEQAHTPEAGEERPSCLKKNTAVGRTLEEQGQQTPLSN